MPVSFGRHLGTGCFVSGESQTSIVRGEELKAGEEICGLGQLSMLPMSKRSLSFAHWTFAQAFEASRWNRIIA